MVLTKTPEYLTRFNLYHMENKNLNILRTEVEFQEEIDDDQNTAGVYCVVRGNGNEKIKN